MYQTFFKTLVACCEPLTKLNSIINLSTYIVYSAGYCQCHRMYVPFAHIKKIIFELCLNKTWHIFCLIFLLYTHRHHRTVNC
ncbi:hypothetical protein [Helicoverpa armigera NPV NNg1]|uniref:Uncharacterized protein n=2 Tax=Helicoverpa armigera nucleopolyhedrovirus TaxID=51313 RepID=B5X002_9ABAC|nr:ORF7 [Helicoverpa SNPV AC53]BAG74572.1 hypothetical protein [Helicoverpa armigera NPV NNg1]AMN15467.1 ORF7 [Helicoverpa SNPV AC53]AMN15605.1 ORF7 [Helicoverpa SNPV AC53]AMN15743.1 ORF7 [Helicoverpa SNPV AC53]